MATNKDEKKPHSAEYFGESRDFWWNADFLELMGKRLDLYKVRTVLDVGCGIGHWGRVLAPLFSSDIQLVGVDREETWISQATERAETTGLGGRYRYQKGDACQLPFKDGSFDMVTCQTVLIHLNDPRGGLKEMLRVLKPGGLLLVAEPNNFANRAVGSSLVEKLSVDEVMARMRFDLMIERGKQALGLGYNSLGEFVPGYFAELGVAGISVYHSDKASPYFAPYSSQEQQVNIEQMRDWAKRKFIGWDRDEVRSYFLAGGGTEREFVQNWEMLIRDGEETLKAIDEGTYHSAGGAMVYLVSGRKA
jgi:ubiquinone/menaquinone biosynthesis C-methylase UbiE